MASAHTSYYAAMDVESLLQSNTPSRASRSWQICLAALVGMACGVLFALHGAAAGTTLPVQAPRGVAVQRPVPSRAVDTRSLVQKVGNGLAALSLATMANLGTPALAPASELDVLYSPTPTKTYVYDDAMLLSRSTVSDLESKLPQLEQKTGYRINVITLRKLNSFEDAFQYADKLIETWYPTAELGDKKAVFVIVKNTKEGGLVGGPSFSGAVPDSLLESIFNDNLGQLLPQEKFNQAVESSIDRIGAALKGEADPGAPSAMPKAAKQTANYKTKQETDSKRSVYIGVFGALMVISFVAPMAQFFGYTKKE